MKAHYLQQVHYRQQGRQGLGIRRNCLRMKERWGQEPLLLLSPLQAFLRLQRLLSPALAVLGL
jgi:hypothetical protein